MAKIYLCFSSFWSCSNLCLHILWSCWGEKKQFWTTKVKPQLVSQENPKSNWKTFCLVEVTTSLAIHKGSYKFQIFQGNFHLFLVIVFQGKPLATFLMQTFPGKLLCYKAIIIKAILIKFSNTYVDRVQLKTT